MDKIEAQVRLPVGARPLADYSRYYAAAQKNEIVATYFIVPKGVRPPDGSVPPGRRRWFNDMDKMPAMSGGGCGQVNVLYDTEKSAVRQVECNGDY